MLWRICAPADHFDLENYSVRGTEVVANVKDPVVLYKVSGGYRIVTAWGPEASDPEILNPLNN